MYITVLLVCCVVVYLLVLRILITSIYYLLSVTLAWLMANELMKDGF
jgi:hypothetical protein